MKKLLVVVDMQNDFIDGSLGTKEAQAIVPNVIAKIKETELNGGFVVFTRDTHLSDYLKKQEGQVLPVKHCIKDSQGWLIPTNIIESSHSFGESKKHVIFNKGTFGSSKLIAYVNQSKYGEVELVGLCTDICVISNAIGIKILSPEVIITVDSSCCAGVTPESHKNALNVMKMCQINIINE